MKVVIKIPKNEIPTKQDIIYVAMHFMDGKIVECDYPFIELEQEPCEDWYDVPSDEMPLEQARQAVKDLRKKLAEHLEQEPCEDAISRKSVLDKIKEVCFSRKQEWVDFRISQGSNGQRDLIINFIEDLPSVQPSPKTEVLDKIRAEAFKSLKENLCALCAYGSQNMDSCDIRSCDNRDAIKVIERSLCDSCTTPRCIFQSGIIRTKCAFYTKPDNFKGVYTELFQDCGVKIVEPQERSDKG